MMDRRTARLGEAAGDGPTSVEEASSSARQRLETISELRDALAAALRDAEIARRDRDHLGARLLDAEQRVATLIQEIQDATERASAATDSLREELDELRASTSWRIMAPFRKLSRVVRRS
jgi:chromosome segregation ATPase